MTHLYNLDNVSSHSSIQFNAIESTVPPPLVWTTPDRIRPPILTGNRQQGPELRRELPSEAKNSTLGHTC